ncbi:MAG: hypothetical protein ACT4QF_14075 [Sporichthyaceae bacterium]
MAIVNATENSQLATAVRGYDRAAVDEVIARETARLRDLEARALQLEREFATPPTNGGVPDPRQKVQQALDVIAAGWDDAIRVTATAEHVAVQSRRHAQHRVSAAMATLEDACAHTERATEQAAVRMVADARQQADIVLEAAAAEHDRAVEEAAAQVRAAADRAQEIATQFAVSLREAEEHQAERLAARFEDAERNVAAAQTELAAARRDVAEIETRAQAAREEILAQARTAAEEILALAGAEMRRRKDENEAALAELGRELIATGDRLVGAPDAESNVSR